MSVDELSILISAARIKYLLLIMRGEVHIRSDAMLDVCKLEEWNLNNFVDTTGKFLHWTIKEGVKFCSWTQDKIVLEDF